MKVKGFQRLRASDWRKQYSTFRRRKSERAGCAGVAAPARSREICADGGSGKQFAQSSVVSADVSGVDRNGG